MVKQLKKTVMVTLFSAAALLLFAAPADAVKSDDKTDVGVSFKADEPITPGENGPYKDNLALIWKPTEFAFGEQKAVANKATFNGIVSGEQYVVINDDRADAVTNPWKLSTKLTALVASDNTDLAGASLAIEFEDPEAYDIGTDIDTDTNDYKANKPDSSSLSALLPNSDIVLNSNTVTLVAAGTAEDILEKTTANAVKGGVSAKIKSTKLTVLDSSAAAGKSFKGQVIWTLDDLQP